MKNNSVVNCQLKKAYKNKEEADNTATYLWFEKQVDVEPYKCQICDSYHLTSGNSNDK